MFPYRKVYINYIVSDPHPILTSLLNEFKDAQVKKGSDIYYITTNLFYIRIYKSNKISLIRGSACHIVYIEKGIDLDYINEIIGPTAKNPTVMYL